MKIKSFCSFTGLCIFIFTTGAALADGIVVSGSRLIYKEGKKDATIVVSNTGKSAYLIQTWVENEKDGVSGKNKVPFIITPPLFRIDGGNDNIIRFIRSGGQLAEDKETLFWLNIKAIPSSKKNIDGGVLTFAAVHRMKLIYRPENLPGTPEDAGKNISWDKGADYIKAKNASPFYINFSSLTLNGKDMKAKYIAPGGQEVFPVSTPHGKLSWNVINDQGGVGKPYTFIF